MCAILLYLHLKFSVVSIIISKYRGIQTATAFNFTDGSNPEPPEYSGVTRSTNTMVLGDSDESVPSYSVVAADSDNVPCYDDVTVLSARSQVWFADG